MDSDQSYLRKMLELQQEHQRQRMELERQQRQECCTLQQQHTSMMRQAIERKRTQEKRQFIIDENKKALSQKSEKFSEQRPRKSRQCSVQ